MTILTDTIFPDGLFLLGTQISIRGRLKSFFERLFDLVSYQVN